MYWKFRTIACTMSPQRGRVGARGANIKKTVSWRTHYKNRENTGILRVSDNDKASQCFFGPPTEKIIQCRFAIDADFPSPQQYWFLIRCRSVGFRNWN
jgi:hypothetical protein